MSIEPLTIDVGMGGINWVDETLFDFRGVDTVTVVDCWPATNEELGVVASVNPTDAPMAQSIRLQMSQGSNGPYEG